jgi:hypothetical protein
MDEIEQPEKMVNKKTSKTYVDNKTFLKLILDYKKNPTKKCYDEIGKIVLMIARRYIMKGKFASYSKDRHDEMISNACLFMITSCIKNFEVEKSDNAFAYMTQACHNSFLQHINKWNLNESRYSNVSFIQNLESVGNED